MHAEAVPHCVGYLLRQSCAVLYIRQKPIILLQASKTQISERCELLKGPDRSLYPNCPDGHRECSQQSGSEMCVTVMNELSGPRDADWGCKQWSADMQSSFTTFIVTFRSAPSPCSLAASPNWKCRFWSFPPQRSIPLFSPDSDRQLQAMLQLAKCAFQPARTCNAEQEIMLVQLNTVGRDFTELPQPCSCSVSLITFAHTTMQLQAI